MSNSLVTVIIPTYKRAKFLKRAVDSVLDQTYINIEVIVVDDNGDNSPYQKETAAIMENYIEDPRVSYYQHRINKNGSAARNTGLNASKGHYIAFLDDDDYFMPTKIEHQYNRLQELGNGWGACYTNYTRQNQSKILDRGKDKEEGDLTFHVLSNSVYLQGGSNLFVESSILKRIGGFDESFKRRQDIEVIIRIMKETKVAFVDNYLLVINMDDRVNVPSLENNIENISYFFEKFKQDIEQFSDQKITKIRQGQYLLLWRFYVQNKLPKEAIELMFREKISIILALRFILYNLKRKISKTSYGFKI